MADHLDAVVIVKVFVVGSAMASQANFWFWGPRQVIGGWVFAMTATRAMAGLAANAASIIRHGEGIGCV